MNTRRGPWIRGRADALRTLRYQPALVTNDRLTCAGWEEHDGSVQGIRRPAAVPAPPDLPPHAHNADVGRPSDDRRRALHGDPAGGVVADRRSVRTERLCRRAVVHGEPDRPADPVSVHLDVDPPYAGRD